MLSVGQVVVLKSGGPRMVVTGTKKIEGVSLVTVVWYFSDGQKQIHVAHEMPASAFKPVKQKAGK